ncbi:aldehyde dehydrogenase family protein [Streptomyces sp. ID05-04B]|nr:aldehyde dehydrogenase family protein [Streptomyces sp. ID05-04B]
MAVEAGRKCTAIRRVLVPREHESAALDAIASRLAGVTIGNPAAEGVRMGAVAGLALREDVRRAVRAITASGRFVHGDPAKVRVVDAAPERGAFLDTLLICADPNAAAPHEVEPFGPAAGVSGSWHKRSIRESRWTYGFQTEASAGSVRGGLGRTGPVVARLQGELTVGTAGRQQIVCADRVGADSRSLQPQGGQQPEGGCRDGG